MNDTAEVALAATAAAPGAPAAPAAPAHAALLEKIRKAYVEHFHGSVVAQHTPHLNHCHDFLTKVEAIISAHE